MKFFSVRSVSFIFLLSLTLVIPPNLLASKDNEDREVYVAFVQGDVRISTGKNHRPDLNQPWQQALGGEPIKQGYALATGNGRAEIEFENGSTVYLAENSLLLFRNLTAPGDRVISRMSLAAGTATFSLQPVTGESFFINTPTDRLELSSPETGFARVDAYLDATGITPQGEKGDRVVRRGVLPFQIKKGETVFFQDGEIVQTSGHGNDVTAILASYVSWESLLPGLPDSYTTVEEESVSGRSETASGLLSVSHTQGPSDWDTWVLARVQERHAVTASALKASGLTSPIPGLVELYNRGKFFNCEPYGTCWEATEPGDTEDDPPQSNVSAAQSAAGGRAQSSGTFPPQTVHWEEWSQGWCTPPTLHTVTRIARTPEEMQKLEERKAAAQKARYSPTVYSSACENGYWIPYRRHFARVVTPQIPPHCAGAKCKPIHAPRPVWVRAGNRIGFVPAHPKDVKGKPPVNLKEGILIPPSRPGERTERVTPGPSQKISVLDKAPREFRSESFSQGLRVSPPEIHAHLVQEAGRESTLSLSAHATPPITYDYKSHHFLMPASIVTGEKSKEVPVGGIDSHGKIGSFADGRHSSFAQAFGRSGAAESYGGGSFGSGGGRGGYSSGYSGGGHASGYSSGSYSSGSHSSGSGSYSGSSSHSSSGGGWSSGSSSGSSGGGSSSSSSSSSGGGSHGKP